MSKIYSFFDSLDPIWEILIIIALAILLSYVIRKLLDFYSRRLIKKIRGDKTSFSFIKNSSSFLIYTAAIIIITFKIPYFNSLGKTLFAGAGILAAILGFASQKALSNIISGVFIIMFRPFSVSDIVQIDGNKGMVEDITLRHTIIRDYENRRIIIPNSVISEKTIINSSAEEEYIRQHIEFGISYSSDSIKAKKIIKEECVNHPLSLDRRSDIQKEDMEPKVMIKMLSWDESSVTFRAYVWANSNIDGFNLKCDVLEKVKDRFQNEGIEIPYPYRNIIINDNTQNQSNEK